MRKNQLVIIIVIIAAVIFLIYGLSKQRYKPTLAPQPSAAPQLIQETVAPLQVTTIVNITKNGFEPKSVSLLKGEKVLWINLDQSAHWPAVDPHPAHTDYPEKGGCINSAFDACRPIQPGGKWEFVFNHAGTWKYHDHLNPSFSGEVIVKEKSQQ
jgi:plastocyanin